MSRLQPDTSRTVEQCDSRQRIRSGRLRILITSNVTANADFHEGTIGVQP